MNFGTVMWKDDSKLSPKIIDWQMFIQVLYHLVASFNKENMQELF